MPQVKLSKALLEENAKGMRDQIELYRKVEMLNRKKAMPRPSMDRITRLLKFRRESQKEKKMFQGHEHDMMKANTGNCHFSNVAKATSLQPIRLSEMQLPHVHYGRVLGCRVFEIGNTIGDRTEMLVEDADGAAETVCIYSLDTVSEGAILLIKEPALHFISDGRIYEILVHSPTDMEFVHESDKETLEWAGLLCWYKEERHSPEELKAQGNKLFAGGDFKGSVARYERALRAIADPESCPALAATLHLNLAAAQLQLECYYEAKKSVKRALGIGVDDSALRGKAFYRLGGAAYGMGQWQEAVDYFEKALAGGVPRAEEELQRARARLHESLTGEYDLHRLYEQAEKAIAEHRLAHMDIADYMGPLERAEVPGKGHGLVLTSDVEAGTLLIACKAYATAAVGNGVPIFTKYLNYATENYGNGLAVHLAYNAMEKLKKNPQTTSQLYALYDGGKVERRIEVPVEGVVDPGRILMMHEFNGSCLKSVCEEEDMASAYGLFLTFSALNHSCLANARHVLYGDVMFIYAVRALKKGEEVTTSYIDPKETFEQRSLHLQMRWLFQCQCALCEAERADSQGEQRREKLMKELAELQKAISRVVYARTAAPQSLVKSVEEVVAGIRDSYGGRQRPLFRLCDALRTLASVYQSAGKFDKVVEAYQESVDVVGDYQLDCPVTYYESWMATYLNGFKPPESERKAKEVMRKCFEMVRIREGLDKALFLQKYFSPEKHDEVWREKFIRLLDD